MKTTINLPLKVKTLVTSQSKILSSYSQISVIYVDLKNENTLFGKTKKIGLTQKLQNRILIIIHNSTHLSHCTLIYIM